MIRAMLAAGTAVLALCLASPAVRAQSPEELFDQATAAYEEGRFDQAAQLYESLLRFRVVDPVVEFNLGNAEFRRGRLGAAILHWERARRLAPTDGDVSANLAYARSLTTDRVEPPPRAALVEWLYGVQNRLGPDRQLLAAVGLFWFAGGLVAWCALRRRGWSPAAGWGLFVLLCAIALVGGSWWMTLERLEGRDAAVVLAGSVEVLAGPGENNATLAVVHEGLLVEVRSEREAWLRVRLPNGVSGWVDRRGLGVI